MKKIVAFSFLFLGLMFTACKQEVKEELPAVMATTTFNIEGMHCKEGCAARIQKKLGKMDGVTEAMVDFENKLATIQYDANKQKPEDFVDLVLKVDQNYVVSEVKTMNQQQK